MFSWKAVLYYRWRIHTLTNPLKTTLRSISRLGGKRSSEDTLRFTMSAKSLLENSIAGAWRGIGETLQLYDQAYTALIERQDPASFRQFLAQGSGLFLDLGERIGRLEQVIGFWSYRLSQHDTMSAEEVVDALRDLLQGMSIWPGAGPEPEKSESTTDVFDNVALAGF